MTLKKSKSSRLSSIAGMGLKVLAKSASGFLSNKPELQTRIDQAKLIVETLSELKGASMKFGQIISLQGETFLPKEVADIFSKLQSSATSLKIEEIEKIIVTQCPNLYKNLKKIQPTPLGSASIGQVHRATLKTGEEIAIKVQYPGIGLAIDAEIQILKKVIQVVSKIYHVPMNVETITEEIKTLLKQEVQYSEELKYGLFFKAKLKKDSHLIVPHFYEDYSNNSILTMSFEEGLSLNEYLKTSPSQDDKNKVALNLMDLLMKEIFTLRTVQTDPNFGNYLFRVNNKEETKIILLDFGATKSYPIDFITHYKNLMKFFIEDKTNEALELSHQLGFLLDSESKEAKDAFIEMCQLSIKPFNLSLDHEEPFHFSDPLFSKKIHQQTLFLIKTLRHTPPPAELIFLNRKLGGIFNLFRILNVSQNLSHSFHKAIYS